jgi:hypothetical protein
LKLNLHILKEDLKDLNPEGNLPELPWTLRLEYPAACTVYPGSFQENILYLLTADLLPPTPEIPENISVLCLGAPPKNWKQAACSFLFLEDSVTLLELFNRVSRAFARYQKWERQLQDILDQNLPLHEMASCSHSLIRNAIYLQGPSFRVLTWTIPEDAESTSLLEDYKKNYFLPEFSTLPADAINTLISDSEYNQAIEANEPSIYSGSLYGFRSLYYNIRINNVFVARLCIDEIISPFTNRDFALAKILGDYLGKGLSAERIYSFNRPKDLDTILHSLLSHRLIPEKKISHVLDSCGWKVNDLFLCLILKLKTREDSSAALEPLALSLTQLLSSECYTIYEGSIVFICNLTRIGIQDGQLPAHILPHLRDNLLTAAFSSVYCDFKDLYYYYNQAKIIFQIGARKNPTQWYFRSEDYLTDYLIYKLKEKNIPGVLIPAGLQRLLEYDIKKGSGYADLLRLYLEKERNIAETIRAAYMHRNTFLYRIRKIQEILQMDLDQPDIRLALQVAFHVMDNAEKEAGSSASPQAKRS